MLTTLRTGVARRVLFARAYTTAAELDRDQISRTVLRTHFAERVESDGPVIRAALRPKDNQSPFILCVSVLHS